MGDEFLSTARRHSSKLSPWSKCDYCSSLTLPVPVTSHFLQALYKEAGQVEMAVPLLQRALDARQTALGWVGGALP